MHKKNHISDGILVTRYVEGDQPALAMLVKRFHKTFCNQAYWIVKDSDAAKDIAQDSWNLIINKVHTLKETERFKSWALRIVHRKAIDWTKGVSKQSQHHEAYKVTKSIRDIPSEDISPLKQKLLTAIKELPTNQQQVIRLYYVHDYSLKEVSEIIKISEGTAKSRLYHAREKLKTILKT
ncbi:RNA polymerase sigma factor [Kordia sp. YSTF-M3]|uniref:RNA polymerase sigma factor n=1 Tax=Kordia aestuariivivens TaxID=2759037 RepID=A0ABR7Q902_9FLAO|nr:RNA polymerase sigma factor [Kordia aestuariivivens]MBC8754804.1 RNA polymerase sigma factor [Kordia aestuariivivens]